MSDLVKHLRAGAADGAHPLTLLSEAADEIDALARQLDEARRDAERYRWLCRFPEDADYEVTHALNGCVDGPSFQDLLSAAIDAARR